VGAGVGRILEKGSTGTRSITERCAPAAETRGTARFYTRTCIIAVLKPFSLLMELWDYQKPRRLKKLSNIEHASFLLSSLCWWICIIFAGNLLLESISGETRDVGGNEGRIMKDTPPSNAVFLNRRAAAWYRALASIIPCRQRFSWNFVILVYWAIFMNKCFIVEIFWGEKNTRECVEKLRPRCWPEETTICYKISLVQWLIINLNAIL